MGLFFIFLVLIFGINIFQNIYLPFTNLAEGMGYDGILYYKSANEFWPKTDNYHLFRQLPSTFVYFIKKIIYRPYDYNNTAKSFQVYNLICNGLAVFFTYLICKKLHLGTLKSSLFFGFVFLNFHILKDSVYNPVMTDSSVLLFSICLLYSFLSMNKILYLLFSVCLLFSFPIGGFLLQIIYFFWDKNFKNDELPYPKKSQILAFFVSICYCLISIFIVPIYEKEQAGVFYNTSAVIDADGTYLGKYRKNHIPHTTGFWEKFFFKPGNLGYPVFQTRYAKVGVYICYNRHFPDGARVLGLNGAEIVYNPSATVSGLSQYLWKLEQPAHAAANGYLMGCINRVGEEKSWNLGRFYGTSYFVDPRGQIFAQASEYDDELLIAEFDLDMIDEVRATWQFFRDRQPKTYGKLVKI